MTTMQHQVLCLLSDVRSGSTLVGQLLGAHSQMVSAGELQWLRAYAREDRRLYNPPHDLVCACGEKFANCQFWNDITTRIGESPADLHFKPEIFAWSGPGAVRQAFHKRMTLRVLRTYPAIFRSKLVQRIFDGREISQNNMKVFQSIFERTGAQYVVDISKNVYRFRSIYEWYPDIVRIVVLYRDYRAVVHSRMKRGVSMNEAAEKWADKVHQIHALTKDIPEDMITTMRYEDLCENPRKELRRACRFLELDFEETMLSRPTKGIHDLGGSPSKFEPGKIEIRFDRDYQSAFSSVQLNEMREIVGSAAELAGYS